MAENVEKIESEPKMNETRAKIEVPSKNHSNTNNNNFKNAQKKKAPFNNRPQINPAHNLNNQIRNAVNQNKRFNTKPNNAYNHQQDDNREKKFTGRCRLFVGNLPLDITENEVTELFSKYGEVGEIFLNHQRGFGFIKLDTRINAEYAKQELDGVAFKARNLRVRFATHGAAVRVKNLSPFVSNEYLDECFSIFGTVERAIVIVDEKGRPTGEGIVEFERKPAAAQCLAKCADGCFLLTNYPKPIVVEALEQRDDEDGLPERAILKNQQLHSERETRARFAQVGSFEHGLAMKWKDLYEQEKQFNEEVKKRIENSKEQLEYEIEQAMIEHKTQMLKEDLRRRQEELQRIEELRQAEFQRRKEMDLRRQEEERMRREEETRYNQNNNNYNFNDRQSNYYVSPHQESFNANNNNYTSYLNEYYQQQNNGSSHQEAYEYESKNSNVDPSVMSQFSSPYMLAAAAAAAAAATAAAASGYNGAPVNSYSNNNNNNSYANRRRPHNNNNNNNYDGYSGFDKKRARF